MKNCLPKLALLPPGLLSITEDCPNTPKEANKMKDILYQCYAASEFSIEDNI